MVRNLKDAAVGFLADNAMQLSAALAYYAAFSLAPLLLIAITLAGSVIGEDAARGQLDQQLHDSLGPSGAWAVQDMVAHAKSAGAGALGVIGGGLMLLFGAGGVFGQLQDSLNLIWKVSPRESKGMRAKLRKRMLSFAMVASIGLLLVASIILSAVILSVREFVNQIASLPPEVWSLVNEAVSFVVVALLFASIFKVLPDTMVPWRCVWSGAMIAALLFVAGKFAMAWYLGREATASRFGNAGALALVLIWVYYSAAILFFGAEYAKVCYLRGKNSA